MKILYLCPDLGVPVLGRKGASVHVREMAEALQRAGHQVLVVAPVLQKNPWEQAAHFSVPILQVKASAETLAVARTFKELSDRLATPNCLASDLRRIAYNKDLESDLMRRLDGHAPDLIYERASLFGMAGGSLARSFRCRLVIELNAPLAGEQTAYRETLFPQLAHDAEKAALSEADRVFVVSETLRKHVLSLGIHSERVQVVPNGINPTLFFPGPRDPKIRANLGLGNEKVIGFVGGLRAWHGVQVFPALLEGLAKNRPVKLLIVGDGPLRLELQKAFAEKELSDRVLFLGALLHEDVPGIIRQFDIALAPYPQHAHSFYFSPLKLFEYLGCGKASVAADVGQIREVIEHAKTGWLYPPGDFPALLQGCEKLLGDDLLRESLGANGAELVHENFTWEKNVMALEAALAGT